MNRALLLSTVLCLSLTGLAACEFSYTTANIRNARLATDEAGENVTTEFAGEAAIYVVFELRNAPDETTVTGSLHGVDEAGKSEHLLSSDLVTGSANAHFVFTPRTRWPAGKYRVELAINGKVAEQLDLTVRE